MSQSTDQNIDVASLVEDVNLKRVGQYTLVVLFLGFFLVPIETGIMTALKTNEAVSRTIPFVPPLGNGFTLSNIEYALGRLSNAFVNSLLMAVPATVINVVLASMAAYGLTMVRWRGQLALLSLFLIGVFVPYQAVLVPLARFWNNIFPLAQMLEPLFATIPLLQGYHSQLVPLIITHVAYGIPICTILFRSYYKGLPNSLVEAAKIDGSSITKIYRRIVLPLSKPMFGVVFIYQFTQIYNEFLFSFTLITSANNPAAPVTLILPSIGASTSRIDFGIRMSAAFLAALPTILLYVAFAEQFTKGLRTESG
ncbi:ABC-type transport system permease protein (probable substrate sugar) (plasmid) [Halobacterium hubeiense]|uniref:ABC-type transport system permease protein (Probable substrate sugar) n=1 Tax=Halobacterium hubeiense TaxID=1407499 RepID=A0A0U5H810_9EURY|nr:carbohydrate ABC transporter permease [Halobacterium hubeiense]CQH63187.1 ABC-type transport system permease protein (probable substrate sugar) [Halobacterium hubeiense]